MVSIADLHQHSVVLDPCAGIGTINIRAALQSHYGIGGELLPSLFEDQAPYFLDCNRKFQGIHHRKGSGATDMAGWDATMLPMRDSIIDAVISDIPFGKCIW
jgi:tRNA G10  N-methylase Trm11